MSGDEYSQAARDIRDYGVIPNRAAALAESRPKPPRPVTPVWCWDSSELSEHVRSMVVAGMPDREIGARLGLTARQVAYRRGLFELPAASRKDWAARKAYEIARRAIR